MNAADTAWLQPFAEETGVTSVRPDLKELHAKIGELAVANDFLSRKLKPWTGK